MIFFDIAAKIKKQINRYKSPIGLVIISLVFYYLFVSLYANWKDVKTFTLNFNYSYLSGAFILLMIRHLIMPYIWQKILNNLYVKINYYQSFSIWYLALGGRYLPGRIWSTVGMFYLSSKIGIPKNKVLISGTFNLALSLMSAFVVGFALLPSYIPWEIGTTVKVLLLIMVLPSFYILIAITTKAVSLFNKDDYNLQRPKTRFICWFYPFILYVITWILYGVSLYFLLSSITQVKSQWVLHIVSSYAISHMAGFISLVTPAGIAVREGMLSILLSDIFPTFLASYAAILCRIVFTFAELSSFCMALLLKKFPVKKSSPF